MSTKTIVLLTGANSGLGLAAAKEFLTSPKPYHVLFAARSRDRGQAALDALKADIGSTANTAELLLLDVADDASISAALAHVAAAHGRIDALVNNAAATYDLEWTAGKVGLRECFTRAYNTNVAGAHVLTYEAMPLLLKSPNPRLIFVAGWSHMTQAAGGLYFPTPPQPAGWPKKIDMETIAYRCTKTALSMLMLDWDFKLKADGVKVWSVYPGAMVTNLGGKPELAKAMGLAPPDASARFLVSVVEGARDGDTGKIVSADGVEVF